MNFDRTFTAPCVIPVIPPADQRCLDAAFALANPGLCGSALILKPSVAMLCELESVQFRVFDYAQSVETELLTGVRFTVSDGSVFALGINTGNGTALLPGAVTVTATLDDGRSVQAELTVLPAGPSLIPTGAIFTGDDGNLYRLVGSIVDGQVLLGSEIVTLPTGDNCCDGTRVLTSIVVDNSKSMSHQFPGYSSRLAFAKAVATSYGGVLYEVNGLPKDADRVWAVNQALSPAFSDFSEDVDAITAAIAAIAQTQAKTDLLSVFTTVTDDLLAGPLIPVPEDAADGDWAVTTFSVGGQTYQLTGTIVDGQLLLGSQLVGGIPTGGVFRGDDGNQYRLTGTIVDGQVLLGSEPV